MQTFSKPRSLTKNKVVVLDRDAQEKRLNQDLHQLKMKILESQLQEDGSIVEGSSQLVTKMKQEKEL